MTIRLPSASAVRPQVAPQSESVRMSRPPTAEPLATNRFRDAMELRPARAPLKQLFTDFARPRSHGAERTTEDALADMDSLLRGPSISREENGATVLNDAPYVNDSRDLGTGLIPARFNAATQQVEANAALESEYLAKMTPEEQAQYESVKQACLDAGDPVAALSLQKLLFEGKLPGEKDLMGEGTLLDQLALAADPETPMVEGLDRGAFLCDLVQELATPSAIAQRGVGTCAPTTLAIDLAMRNPAEYARIAMGLASPEGKVTLAGGMEIEREPGTATEDGKDRSNVQRLMGSALMEVANGSRDYDNETEEGDGANARDLDTLNEAIWGRPMEHKGLGTPKERAEAMDIIDAQLAAGHSVSVGLTWGEDSAHKVLVTGTETIDGQEYINYINPWGREERMLREEFEARMIDINYDPKGTRPIRPPGIHIPVASERPPALPPEGLDLEQLRRAIQLRG
ncbi:hypothetical protein [Melittangium boletus]|uniref:Uncharacterized protein n=1 Tax=Melittangium boletus DSM 14713 TaxID=1294270 RepID=A0A250IE18_9BACT|nr:hypothetical protein [Melittangium boletus]ATB29483.1 hypothetical protein MEBOL_002933 [Melittangium boletus DSM 14713]